MLWRDANTVAVAIWLLNGLQILQSVSVGTVGTDWQIIETGDFNGDGKSDILWRSSSFGAIAMWFMNGGQIMQSEGIGFIGNDWTIQNTNAD